MELFDHPILTDTHCHLYFTPFNEDRLQVVRQAIEAGVQRMLNPGIDLLTSKASISLAEAVPEIYAAVGVHPNDAIDYGNETIEQLRGLTSRAKVVAVGEIGLDYYHNDTPHDLQKRVFRDQLDLAAEVGLPVVIHNRESTQDVMDILRDWHQGLIAASSPLAERPGVLHSFSANRETAFQALDMNFFIGITGPVTFKNKAEVLQDVVASVPLTSLLIETDAPFLAPMPHRGQRNEPAYVALVAEKIASIRNQPYQTVAETTSANARRLFHW